MRRCAVAGPARRLDEAGLRLALDALAGIDPAIAQSLARVGYPSARLRPPGFATLLQIVTAQQVSARAAATVFGRLQAAMGGEVSPDRLLKLEPSRLRGSGLGPRKAVVVRELAEAIVADLLPLERLGGMPDGEVVRALTGLRGFGRWSAEIYLLFALGRTDVFPADDLALQLAFKRLKGLPVHPKARELRGRVAAWSPHRGAAAVFLWHDYATTVQATARAAGSVLPR